MPFIWVELAVLKGELKTTLTLYASRTNTRCPPRSELAVCVCSFVEKNEKDAYFSSSSIGPGREGYELRSGSGSERPLSWGFRCSVALEEGEELELAHGHKM